MDTLITSSNLLLFNDSAFLAVEALAGRLLFWLPARGHA